MVAKSVGDHIIESDHIDSPEYSIIKGCAYGSKSLIKFIQNDLETSINDYHRAYTLLSANEASKLDLKTLIYNRAIMLMKRGDGKEASSILADWIDLYGDDEDILTLKASLM